MTSCKFFIGAHFLPMKQVQEGVAQVGELADTSSGKEHQAKTFGEEGKVQVLGQSADKLSETVGKSVEKTGEITIENVGGKTVQNTGEKTNEKADEKSGKTQIKSRPKGSNVLGSTAEKNTGINGQADEKTTSTELKSKEEDVKAVKPESNQRTTSESDKKKINSTIKNVQQVSKNLPGASIAVENKVPSTISNGQMASPKLKGNPMNNVRQALADAVDGKLNNSTNGQKTTSQQNSNTAAVPKNAKSTSASNQTSAGQKHPALKHLSDQAEENAKKVKTKTTKPQVDTATKQAQQAATGKSAVSHVTQNFAATPLDKMPFKPIQQTSSVFELDPSKIIKMESSGSGDVEMELQTQADKDASTKDGGKASLKFNGPAINQLNQTSGRREFSAQLVRHLQQQSGSGKSGSAKAWNHHRFVMDDGQSLNVSVRHAEGAMQLQLSAGNGELNKIIQQHIDEIRQHLQEHVNVEIDLQLSNFGDPQTGSESDGLRDSTDAGSGLDPAGQVASSEKQSPTRSARYLGFNNNEWTA